MENINAKAIARNSMLEKLRSKIVNKKIHVEPVSEAELDEDDEDSSGSPLEIYRKISQAQKEARTVEVPKVPKSSLVDANYLYAVVEADGNLIGGTIATVESELSKLQPKEYEIKLITSDENAAKAMFKEETVATKSQDLPESEKTKIITDEIKKNLEYFMVPADKVGILVKGFLSGDGNTYDQALIKSVGEQNSDKVFKRMNIKFGKYVH